jgi:hypothetical protein
MTIKVNRVVKIFIIVFILFVAWHFLNDYIFSDSNGKVYYIATTDLNVRTGAGTEFPVILTLQEGSEVEVLSRNINWYHIRYLEHTGYAFSEYLAYSRNVGNTNDLPSNESMTFFLKAIIVGAILIFSIIIFSSLHSIRSLRSITKPNRGTRSERKLVLVLLKYGIPAEMIFHDLYLKKSNGKISQIDLVVVTEVGIIVFEVKDYSGWIFGSGNQSQWTQVLAYGKQKFRFYNPIIQNNRHVEELRRKLKHLDNVPFYSIVLFYGDCQLKDINYVPKGVYLVKSKRIKDVLRIILKENKTYEYADKNIIIDILNEAVENGDKKEIQIEHIENIKDMIGKHRIFE